MINKEIDYGDNMAIVADTDITTQSELNDAGEEKAVSNILKPDIPKEAWKREVERVGGKLKIDYNIGTYNTTEWRVHVEQIKTHETNFNKSIPNSRGVLERLSEDIDRILEKISKKEAMISKNFSNIVIFNILKTIF